MKAHKCKECSGTGTIVFTLERGGPVCNTCLGQGYLTKDLFIHMMARFFDGSSVYMGGPSKHSRKKAERLVENFAFLFEGFDNDHA